MSSSKRNAEGGLPHEACLLQPGPLMMQLIAYMKPQARLQLFRSRKNIAASVFSQASPMLHCKQTTRPALATQTLVLAEKWKSNYDLYLEYHGEHSWRTAMSDACLELQQTAGFRLAGATSVTLDYGTGAPENLVPDFLTVACPRMQHLHINMEHIDSLVGACMPCPQLTELSIAVRQSSSSTSSAAQLEKQLKCLPNVVKLAFEGPREFFDPGDERNSAPWRSCVKVLGPRLEWLQLRERGDFSLPSNVLRSISCMTNLRRLLIDVHLGLESEAALLQQVLSAAPALTHLHVDTIHLLVLAQPLPAPQLQHLSCRCLNLASIDINDEAAQLQQIRAAVQNSKAYGGVRLWPTVAMKPNLHSEDRPVLTGWQEVLRPAALELFAEDGLVFQNGVDISETTLSADFLTALAQRLKGCKASTVEFMLCNWQPGVFASMPQLLPGVSQFDIRGSGITAEVVTAFCCKAGRPVTLKFIRENTMGDVQAMCSRLLAACGQHPVTLTWA